MSIELHLPRGPTVGLTLSPDRWGTGETLPVVGAVEAAGGKRPRASHIEAVDKRHVTKMMEQLQQGYVTSVAATAGCTLEVVQGDIWGYDVRFVRPPRSHLDEESMLLAQLKCTTQITPDPAKDYFSYQFTKRQYFDHLVKPRSYPKAILVVMTTPTRQADWTDVSHEGLVTKRCCYWAHLEGIQADPSVKKPSVRIPTKNRLDAVALTKIMEKLDRGEPLND
ncbi:DUF4365 domain-containing protein [Streptomyces coerulescens]|uniref:DUF4365 domain-containing protein n=1 Tax=Streptomyces coerulescens TaxID=29304 RepID=A0ABW0CGI9_STRCD